MGSGYGPQSTIFTRSDAAANIYFTMGICKASIREWQLFESIYHSKYKEKQPRLVPLNWMNPDIDEDELEENELVLRLLAHVHCYSLLVLCFTTVRHCARTRCVHVHAHATRMLAAAII